MATTTAVLGLRKPAGADNVDVTTDISNNMQLIDDLVVPKSVFDANTMLYATTDNTPVALTVGASTVVGRRASGNIVAISYATLLTDIGAAPTVSPTFTGGVAISASQLYFDTGGLGGGLNWGGDTYLYRGAAGQVETPGIFYAIKGVYAGSNSLAGQACALLSGTGIPPAGLGATGDYYLRLDGGVATHIYFKSAGTWVGIV